MGKKDAAKKAATKARQEVKQNKASKKLAKKEAREAGEDDIEKILAEIIAKDAEKTAVTVTACDAPPSPRANFSMTSLPSGDMVMFGGEYFDGEDTMCYNELYRWNMEKGEWRRIESPNTPPPRCSHQAVFYRDHIYIFGGEFATSEQFYHYKDLWRLDIKTNSWENVELLGRPPSARSGHRMAVYRKFLILFGGFYEAAREVKWYNDLYFMSFQDMRWRRIEVPVTAVQPQPRSGHQIAIHESASEMFLYGGYSKVKEPGQRSEGKVHNDMWVLNLQPLLSGGTPMWDRIGKRGAPPSQRSGAAMVVHKSRALLFGGVLDQERAQHTMDSQFYADLYAFDMERRQWYRLQLKRKKGAGGRRRKKGPDDAGDASDDETDEGGAARNGNADDADRHGGDGNGGGDDYIDSEDERAEAQENPDNAFVYIDASGKLVYVEHEKDDDADETDVTALPPPPPTASEDSGVAAAAAAAEAAAAEAAAVAAAAAAAPLPLPEIARKIQARGAVSMLAEPQEGGGAEASGPLPRINPALAVRGNTLYVYGGLLEVRDREYTLDDCWSLELNARTEWKNLQPGTMNEQAWKDEEMSEQSSEGGDYDSEDDYLERQDEDEDEVEVSTASAGMTCLQLDDAEGDVEVDAEEEAHKKKEKKEAKKRRGEGIRAEIRALQEQLGTDDPNRTPLAGETLRLFYARTANYWATEFLRAVEQRGTEERGLQQRWSEKEIRRDAFALAEARFAELEPALQRLNELEAEQAAMEARAAEKKALKKTGGSAKDKGRR